MIILSDSYKASDYISIVHTSDIPVLVLKVVVIHCVVPFFICEIVQIKIVVKLKACLRSYIAVGSRAILGD